MVITYFVYIYGITYFVYIYGDYIYCLHLWDYIFVFVVLTHSEDGVCWPCSEAPREEIA